MADQSGRVLGAVIQRLAQMRNILCEISFFHKGVSPHGWQQFLLGDYAVRVCTRKVKTSKALG